jgi:heat shock protein HtpX
MKRIGLFIVTNVLVITTLWVVVNLFGLTDLISGSTGMNLGGLLILAAVFGFGGAFISLAISKWMAKTMMGVRVIDPNANMSPDVRWLLDTVHAQARAAGLTKMPEVGIYESEEVNAFATGPGKNNSLVAVSSGLLNRMDRDAVEGVLAHEVAHVANGDMVTMTLLQGVVNTFAIFLARIAASIATRFVPAELAFVVYMVVAIGLQIFLTILGSIVVMAFSRHREFHADAGGASLASREKMIHALQSLQRNVQMVDNRQQALQTLKINGGPSKLMKLFSSHPPLEQRIAALQK